VTARREGEIKELFEQLEQEAPSLLGWLHQLVKAAFFNHITRNFVDDEKFEIHINYMTLAPAMAGSAQTESENSIGRKPS